MPGKREHFETITRSAFDASGLSPELARSRLACALSRYDEGERTVKVKPCSCKLARRPVY